MSSTASERAGGEAGDPDLAARLEEAAGELYGADPGGFIARRDARVAELRRSGDKELAALVKALRRPSAAAAVVNRLARQRPEELARLVQLGSRMREAQASLAGEELRGLGRQRQQLVVALGREATRLAEQGGSRVSGAIEREVESTLDAALADPAAGAAVQSGRLLRALEHRGLEVDLDGAVGGGLPPPAQEDLGAATKEQEAADARRRALESAEADERDARARLERAQDARAEAEGTVERAERAAAERRRDLERAETELEAARRARDRADEELERARRLAEEATERLTGLRGS